MVLNPLDNVRMATHDCRRARFNRRERELAVHRLRVTLQLYSPMNQHNQRNIWHAGTELGDRPENVAGPERVHTWLSRPGCSAPYDFPAESQETCPPTIHVNQRRSGRLRNAGTGTTIGDPGCIEFLNRSGEPSVDVQNVIICEAA
jgi:hypothetical protein